MSHVSVQTPDEILLYIQASRRNGKIIDQKETLKQMSFA